MSSSEKQLCGGEFWTDGYFASTVGKHGDEGMIARYVRAQGKDYRDILPALTAFAV